MCQQRTEQLRLRCRNTHHTSVPSGADTFIVRSDAANEALAALVRAHDLANSSPNFASSIASARVSAIHLELGCHYCFLNGTVSSSSFLPEMMAMNVAGA